MSKGSCPAHAVHAPMVSLLASALLLLSGCGGEDSSGGGGGGAPTGCQAPEIELPDGRCIRPGVPPDGCASGFVHDDAYGCEPVLPAEDCAPGMLAVPGDTACRPVMPCAPGRWGDIPGDATTQYVDGSYAGGTNDGSTDRPRTTIQEAVDAALPDAIIAIAAGSYHEDVSISSKAVKLWGVCPDQVEVVGAGTALAAIVVASHSSGTELRGLAVRGPKTGVAVGGSENVVLDQLWVHDTGSRGIEASSVLGPTSLALKGSLIENAGGLGMHISGSMATVEASAVRNTLPRPSDQSGGHGVTIHMACPNQQCDHDAPATATISGSLIEGSRDIGLLVMGSRATVEGTVIRRTWPQQSDDGGGMGVLVSDCDPSAGCDPAVGSTVTVSGSLVEDSRDYGLLALGSQIDIDSTVIRRTSPRQSDQSYGRGLDLRPSCHGGSCDRTTPASGTVTRSLIEDSHDIGLLIAGAQATIDAVAVRGTEAQQIDLRYGRGINIQGCNQDAGCDPALMSNVTITDSLVEQNHEIGLCIIGSDATVTGSIIRATRPRPLDGWYGDGLSVTGNYAPSSVTIDGLLIDDSARAALSNFGAHVAIGSSRLRCADFAMEGDDYMNLPFVFDDLGDVLCGCPEADDPCVAVSAGLKPPDAF